MDYCHGDSDTFEEKCCLLPVNKLPHQKSQFYNPYKESESLSVLSPHPHLRETALVIQNPQYPMRLSGNEVDAGLVVVECDVLPWDLLPAVLLLQQDHIKDHKILVALLPKPDVGNLQLTRYRLGLPINTYTICNTFIYPPPVTSVIHLSIPHPPSAALLLLLFGRRR